MSQEDIENLPGVGGKTAEKLVEMGFNDLMSLAAMSGSELAATAEIGEKSANKIINAARDQLELGFSTGVDKLKQRENIGKISTGSSAFDELLGGGIPTQCISELYGAFGASKTQLALQLAVNVQQKAEDGGLEKGVVFIDTEDTFIPERVKQMAEARGLDPEAVLSNIYVARAFNSDHQVLLTEKAQDIMSNNEIGLVVVDSLMSHFRADYVGRGELASRQQTLNKHMHMLLRYANTYNTAVVVTNQVMSRPDILFGDPTSPIGGHIVGHTSSFRIYLRKSKKDSRIARLVDSPYLPEGEAVFKVSNAGIEDA